MISQVLLKLLAKLLTVCVIFADHTRLVMQDIAKARRPHARTPACPCITAIRCLPPLPLPVGARRDAAHLLELAKAVLGYS